MYSEARNILERSMFARSMVHRIESDYCLFIIAHRFGTVQFTGKWVLVDTFFQKGWILVDIFKRWILVDFLGEF